MSQAGGDIGGDAGRETGRPARRRGPVFLERETYRQRRLIDAAWLLPMLGAFLWALPLLWGKGGMSTSAAMLYIFGIWVLLVIGAGLLSSRLRRVDHAPGAAGPADDEAAP